MAILLQPPPDILMTSWLFGRLALSPLFPNMLLMSRRDLGLFLINDPFLPIANNHISKHCGDLFKVQALGLRHEEKIEEPTDDARHDEDDIIPATHQLPPLQLSHLNIKNEIKGDSLPTNAFKSQWTHLSKRNTNTIANEVRHAESNSPQMEREDLRDDEVVCGVEEDSVAS
jgi:hypothetical protein